ncbi:hypothetical protein AB0A77_02095 [Streptomyces varsoviensis]|uniref:hypothetical protein n=1 Tax=Streptomyces varsoviensis TaxID=67373 RepID=UPI00340D827C
MSEPVADAVEIMARSAVAQGSSSWITATVSAVRDDGTCDIDTAAGPVIGVRRLSSYASPQVGDVVQVDKTATGNWLITGATATGAVGWQPLTLLPGFSWTGGAADPYPQARVTDDGLLQLSGIVKGAAPAGTGTQFATLPPSVTTSLWIRGTVAVTTSGNVAVVAVNPVGGAVGLYPAVAHAAGTWFQLDGISGRSR